ncbi:MAG: signal peptidase I [Alphaproteobacteria bacterium]|nr:MAG: signal peptidase I [Alphaproteobacteria bacterium]
MNDAAQQVWSFVKTMAIAAFIAFFCIRGFVFEPFKIPSSSMMPTLHIGDYLIVSKFAYGNRLPLTDFFFWERDPKRGDIVVFKRNGSGLPGSFFGLGKTLFIKRIVAVPGDRIAYNNQTLFINGRVVTTEDLSKYDLTLPNGKQVQADLKKENLLGVEHEILRVPGEAGPVLSETVVREGMYVMVGDNRDNSLDSRFWQWPSWGFVPKEDIMGRAEFIFWSWDENWKPRLERIGNGLRAHMTIGLGQTLEDARGGATA